MKKSVMFTMTEKVYLYPSETTMWHFVPVTKSVGKEIKETYSALARGFGSLPVSVTIGDTTWTTSIFPDKYSGSYILPLKAAVRKKEGVEAGEPITYTITLLVK